MHVGLNYGGGEGNSHRNLPKKRGGASHFESGNMATQNKKARREKRALL